MAGFDMRHVVDSGTELTRCLPMETRSVGVEAYTTLSIERVSSVTMGIVLRAVSCLDNLRQDNISSFVVQGRSVV